MKILGMIKKYLLIFIGIVLLLSVGVLMLIEYANNTQEDSIVAMEKAINNQSFSELAECVDRQSAESLLIADQIYSAMENVDKKQAFSEELNLEEARAKSFQIIQRKAALEAGGMKKVPSLIVTNDGMNCQVSYVDIELTDENGYYYVLLR